MVELAHSWHTRSKCRDLALSFLREVDDTRVHRKAKNQIARLACVDARRSGVIFRLSAFRAMSPDSLFSINAGCQFFLIILGVYVAVKPHSGVEHPWRVIGIFVLLGGIGMIAAIRQQQISARETAEAQRQLAESNAKLSSSIQKAADIAQEAIGASTGGESFCYLMSPMRNHDGTPGVLVFAQQGKSPLYEVQVMVLNLQFYDPSKIERGKKSHLPFKIGDLPVGSAWPMLGADIPFNKAKMERQDYEVNYSARNGWWTQDLLFGKKSVIGG